MGWSLAANGDSNGVDRLLAVACGDEQLAALRGRAAVLAPAAAQRSSPRPMGTVTVSGSVAPVCDRSVDSANGHSSGSLALCQSHSGG